MQDKLDAASAACHTALVEHLTDMKDVESVHLNLEFSGRGEFLRDADEILNKVFSWEHKDAIVTILERESDPLEALKQLDFLSNFTPESLVALVNFWKECEYPPAMCNIDQTLQPDGKIHMTISCDEF